MTCAYDFTLPALSGEPIDLSSLRGKPILIVNTASKCGFTPQYEGLQGLWTTWRSHDLTVLGVPSNDFGAQEPGNAQEIGAFCERNYHVTFPLAAKCHVRGPQATPLFRWLAQQGGFLARPRWNFYKYLIGRDGTLVNWFMSITPPESRRVRMAVERAVMDH
ncbi:glutathione peroxidase [Novacetimonas hansenii]|uniref:Glutathione peroxidase n=2 Tax=Novacetimonas hansenii TaxID=436 RepID=A0AAW5ENK2_NOVHA|nr:glutathione peroxidase [Novacetimonas hansenii]EFG84941.1 glutathione peroxidase [Novacetimonas hansenii ATCC 23769]MBL7237396.1 glutathione peroxidase [Novacetimonas hansenii]MCJ8353343.1 glutathione peroxidase [Novacetimonas hansenii]PYD73555.1 glutathione peroxidase [Novacetimonas hansenii]QOF94658.1 glutathione peroxidase [Novacetimonas hansenii]